ncbi:MAG: hypothetical protein MHM6MM_000027 [Cercozoa sp. M6MM]
MNTETAIRVAVLGDSGVGKSALVQRLMGQTPDTRPSPYFEMNCMMEGDTVIEFLEVVDASMFEVLLTGVHVILIVFDSGSPAVRTKRFLNETVQRLLSFAEHGSLCARPDFTPSRSAPRNSSGVDLPPILLVANKCDTSSAERIPLSLPIHCEVAYVSAKEGSGDWSLIRSFLSNAAALAVSKTASAAAQRRVQAEDVRASYAASAFAFGSGSFGRRDPS